MDNSELTPAVIIANLPHHSLCGIDLVTFTTTPAFRGLKHLPPGWHFVFCSPTSSFSLRQGVWFHVFDPFSNGLVESSLGAIADSTGDAEDEWRPDLHVLNWDATTETLGPEHRDEELLRWRANLGALWRGNLAPYRQSADAPKGASRAQPVTNDDGEVDEITQAPRADDQDDVGEQGESENETWRDLTSHVTAPLLRRICSERDVQVTNGGHGPRRASLPTDSSSHGYYGINSASSAPQDCEDIPGLEENDPHPQRDAPLNLLPISLKQTWREGAVGRERTDAAQDRTWYLKHLLNVHCGNDIDSVVGELQFTFLLTLTLSNHSCFEGWKRILQLLLTCKAAVAEQPELFVKAISTLRLQLERSGDGDGGLLDLSDDAGNLLKPLIRRFRRNVETLDKADFGERKQDVLDELEDLEDYLRTEHGWTIGGTVVKRGMVDLDDGERVELEAEEEEDGDEGEFAPQLVGLSADQLEGISDGTVLSGDEIADLLRRRKTKGTMGKEVQSSGSESGSEAESSDHEMAVNDEDEDLELEDMDSRY